MIDLGALLSVPTVELEIGFDISPDGQRVAYSWNRDGGWEIYEISLRPDAGYSDFANSEPRLISRGPGGKFSPHYSPDGKQLAYVVDFNGGENFHIFLHDFATAEQTDLTINIKGSLQTSFAWSPDGNQIAFISDQAGQFNVYIMSLLDRKEYLVLNSGFPAWKLSWSPDGAHLAVMVEASGVDYGTFIVRMENGAVTRISDRNGPIDAGQANWSPDSQHLAFSSDAHGFDNIGDYDVSTRSVRWLTKGDGEKQFPAWSPDGKQIAYIFNHGTVSWLAVQKPGRPAQKYQIEPGVHYLPRFLQDGKHILLGFDNPNHPGDLWLFSLDKKKFTQLTHSMTEEMASVSFVMPEEITYSGMDGKPVPALLFKSQLSQPGAAVIVIHGGPDWFFEMTWYPFMAQMASRGWTVLAPNYRGSTGYGRSWQQASRFDFGGVDTEDVAAGAIFLQHERLCDPKRIAVTGRSHGGYLTASCLTRYPELWAAGSAVVPFLNWFINHEEMRPDLQQWDLENFGDPVENYDLWKEHSPSFFLERIAAPLQLICARHDARCPVKDSIEAEAALRKRGKVVELIIYEDEGHAFLKRENILDSETRRLAFLAKYIGD